MDQIKTGEFLAKERKQLGLTQQELADRLGVSNRTISKWECGRGFPEISLLLPLCEVLSLSVNELLSGERLEEKDYREKAEEHIVDFIKEKEDNRRRFVLATVTGMIATVSFLTLVLVVCAYSEVMTLAVRLAVVAIAVGIFAVGMYVAMQGERSIGYYRCKHCGELFVPTWGAYMAGMHIVTTRWLRCPRCHKKGWCKKVMSRDASQ